MKKFGFFGLRHQHTHISQIWVAAKKVKINWNIQNCIYIQFSLSIYISLENYKKLALRDGTIADDDRRKRDDYQIKLGENKGCKQSDGDLGNKEWMGTYKRKLWNMIEKKMSIIKEEQYDKAKKKNR